MGLFSTLPDSSLRAEGMALLSSATVTAKSLCAWVGHTQVGSDKGSKKEKREAPVCCC